MNLGEDTILNNRYRILRVLSDKGGMGMIYQAHDLNLNGTVVIKQSRFTEQELRRQYPHLPAEQVRSQAEYLRKAFEREAKLLFGLRHSALPRVIDYFATPDGNQFFVMEFIPGKDFGELLSERLRQNQGPFPLDQVLGWAEQILDVLHYLHTNFDPPVIHRDIKPQNLKLMPSGQVILLDFGLAKGARPGMSVVESVHGHTPHYAPLEQINRKAGQEQPTDPRSDIYSLAVTLYHLLTGQLPPDAVERVAETISGGDDPLRPARELSAQIPLAVSEVLQRAAALNPAAVSKAKAGSLTVIGYVHTSYGSRDPAVVKAEIDAYKTWYGVDGIFLDEVSTDVAGVSYYRGLATYIKANPGRLVVLNPGTFPAEDYALVGDIILVFDDSYSAYVSVQTPAWVFNYPANKFWHVVYSVPTAQEMREAIRLSRQRNGRHVYVSDGVLPNPFDSLPSYWLEELREI